MMSVLKHHVAALGLFTAIVLVLSWPGVAGLSTHVIGEGGDPWQTMWRFEEQESGISNIEFWRDFFGGGDPRLVNYSTLPWMPLQIIFGQPATYNLVWLISFILSGYTMYLLVYSLTRHTIGALLAGLAYMMVPYHFAHALGHFGAMQLQWLPIAIVLLRRFVRVPTTWTAVGLAAVVTIQAWTEHHYALWLVLFAGMYLWHERRSAATLFTSHRSLVSLVAVLLLAGIIVPYWPTIQLGWQADSPLDLGVDQSIRFSADLVSYVVPASWHPFWGLGADHLFRQHFTGNVAESTHYVGWVVLLLVIFFRHRIPTREYGFWLIVALVFLLLSLGPRLHIMGRILPVPLPYAVVDTWPVFSAVRAVGRAGVMVALAACVLFGWVIATQVRRSWVGGVVGCLVLLDFLWLGVPRQPYGISPAYATVAELPGSRIIEIPAATNYTIASRALYMSRRHGKEVVGSIALERAEDGAAAEEIRSLPALRQLLYLRTGQLRIDRPDFFDQALPETVAETLSWLEAGAIVVHRDSVSSLQLATLRNFLETDMGLPAQEFDDVIVYAVSEEVHQRGDGVFLARDGRWENVGFDEERGSVFAAIPVEVGFSLYNTTDALQEVQLSFLVAPESHANLLFMAEGSRQEIAAEGGERVTVVVELPAHQRQSYTFRNQLTEKIIIQDPVLTVL